MPEVIRIKVTKIIPDVGLGEPVEIYFVTKNIVWFFYDKDSDNWCFSTCLGEKFIMEMKDVPVDLQMILVDYKQ